MTTNAATTPILRVKAGAGSASAGVWLRLRAKTNHLLLPTVAHILYARNHHLRNPVYVNGIKATIRSTIPLPESGSFTADAALLGIPENYSNNLFFPAKGHLNRFYKGIGVRRSGHNGKLIYGQLTKERWAGQIAYHFGKRRLANQWIVRTDIDRNISARSYMGDSGAVWMTDDGVAVGLQVGVIRSRPHYVIVTPFETICTLFKAAIAG